MTKTSLDTFCSRLTDRYPGVFDAIEVYGEDGLAVCKVGNSAVSIYSRSAGTVDFDAVYDWGGRDESTRASVSGVLDWGLALAMIAAAGKSLRLVEECINSIPAYS